MRVFRHDIFPCMDFPVWKPFRLASFQRVRTFSCCGYYRSGGVPCADNKTVVRTSVEKGVVCGNFRCACRGGFCQRLHCNGIFFLQQRASSRRGLHRVHRRRFFLRRCRVASHGFGAGGKRRLPKHPTRRKRKHSVSLHFFRNVG